VQNVVMLAITEADRLYLGFQYCVV